MVRRSRRKSQRFVVRQLRRLRTVAPRARRALRASPS